MIAPLHWICYLDDETAPLVPYFGVGSAQWHGRLKLLDRGMEMWYTIYSSVLNCSKFNCSEVKHLSQPPNVLAHFLRQGCGLLDDKIGEIAAKWQLSASELQILLFLDQMPQLDTARDAAQYCGMSKASVSGNVLKLATRGLLTVDVDLKDRRFQHLALTERSEPILWDARAALQEFEACVLGALNADEKEHFVSLLEKISAAGNAASTISDTGKDQ